MVRRSLLPPLPKQYDPSKYLETLVSNLNKAYKSARKNIESRAGGPVHHFQSESADPPLSGWRPLYG